MKIKAINPKVRSMKLQVPYDGLITINEEGVAEVSDKAAKLLVNGTADWAYLTSGETKGKGKKDGEQEPKKTEPTPPEENEEVVEETETPEDGDGGKEEVDETKLIIDGIKKMSLEEMIATAKDAGYPEDEYKKFMKKDKMMAAYLIKKYNESQKTTEQGEE